MRVLLAEDHVMTARGISLALKAAGIIVDHADQGEEALQMVRHYGYDAVLVSSRLPDVDGLDVVRRMRSARHDVPVLVLAGENSAQVRIKALGVGADDVMTKPMDHEELVARLRAIVRRSKGFSAPTVRVGGLQIDLNTHDVLFNDSRVALTGKEFAILQLLVMRKNQVLTKDAFLNHLYGGMDEPEGKIIDVFICKLRKKFQAVGAANLISTVWGRGYILREAGVLSASAAAFDVAVSQVGELVMM